MKKFCEIKFSQVDCVIPENRLTGSGYTKLTMLENEKVEKLLNSEICLLLFLLSKKFKEGQQDVVVLMSRSPWYYGMVKTD
jgi:hypothetical protein